MDVTLLPPSTILSHHSHQIYHHPSPTIIPSSSETSTSTSTLTSTLLPSPMNKRNWSHFVPPKLISGFNNYRYRRRPFESLPPQDGSSPINQLPDELWLEILKFLTWQELLAIRTVDKRISNLVLTNSLHHSLSFSSLPPLPLPSLLSETLLPSVRHLKFHLFPYPSPNSTHPTAALMSILQTIPPGQLKSLSLPFSSPYLPSSELGEILPNIGSQLEKLDLRGSAISGRRWTEWITQIGRDGSGLKELDLSFTIISTLPRSPTSNGESISDPFRNIQSLSLASCTNLPVSVLTTFLANLPPTLASLDLSRLEQIPFSSLWNMKVIHRPTPSSPTIPTALTHIKVVGIDHLTRTDIRRLKRHWESQRRSCTCFPPVQESLPKPKKVWGEPQIIDLNQRESFSNYELLTPPRTPSSDRISSTPSPGILSTSSRMQWALSSGESTSSSSLSLSLSSSPEELGLPIDHPFNRNNNANSNQNHNQAFGLLTPPSSVSPPRVFNSPLSEKCLRNKEKELEMKEKISINITHSAILESEDEAGYRQFIGEVTGGVIIPGREDDEDEDEDELEDMVVEVDQGGLL